MNKKVSYIYTALFALVAVSSYFFNINFREDLPRKLSESVFWLAIPALIFSLMSFFLKENAVKAWSKFTNYFLIISLLIILITPTSTHGLDPVPLVKETVTILLATIYSAISLILILYKSFKKDKISM